MKMEAHFQNFQMSISSRVLQELRGLVAMNESLKKQEQEFRAHCKVSSNGISFSVFAEPLLCAMYRRDGLVVRASASRSGGRRFEPRPGRVIPKTFKMVPTAFLSDARHSRMEKGS